MDGTISVAMPVFNRADWIVKTLEHIFNQTVPVDEVVLCDDGSTDDLEAALVPFRDRVVVVRIENSGPAIARKTAVECCSGEWIALCDSDDYWERNHIENFVKAKTLYPQLDFYFCDFRLSDNQNSTKFQQAPEDWLIGITQNAVTQKELFLPCTQSLLESLLDFQACFQSCLIFNRELYDRVGGIKPYVSMWRSEDFHLTARMASQARAVVCTEPVVTINKHGGNFSSEYTKTLKGEVDVLVDLIDQRLVPQDSMVLVSNKLVDLRCKLFRAFYWSAQYSDAVTVARKIPRSRFDARDMFRFAICRLFKALGRKG